MLYMRHSPIIFVVLVLFLGLFCNCSKEPTDERLAHIAQQVSTSPRNALDSLKKIDRKSLTDANRHFYDLLLIKARDKNYIKHTSDSLILDVVAFYKGTSFYPEALYYGGRVYCDIGDFPSSLEFFHRSFDAINKSTLESLKLKGAVASQTGRLLNKLRLYDQAIPYLMEALRIDSITSDTFNLAYDNELIGAIHLHQDKFQDADKFFIVASKHASNLSREDLAHMQMYRAAIKLYQNDIDSAKILINGVASMVRPIHKNIAYIYASDIYLAANMNDSAYYYADKLIHTTDPNNRKNGYRNLFSSELYPLIPSDSIQNYIVDYSQTLECYYNSHESQQALIQNGLYNYQIQQRERNRAEKRNYQFAYIVGILFIVVLIFIIATLYLKYKKRALQLSLQSTIIELNDLQKSLANPTQSKNEQVKYPNSRQSIPDLDSLKSRLQEQINHLMNESAHKTPVNSIILNSEIFLKINNYILENKTIPENSYIWEELEQIIISSSPLFKEHLRLLVGQDLKPHDYHVVLLIRCGITPTQMTILLGRTKGTISYRRKHVCEMVLGQKIDSQFIDDIIRCI